MRGLECRWGGDKVGRAPVIIAGLLGSCVANLILGPLPWLHLRAGGHSSVWVAITILVGIASSTPNSLRR